MNRRNFCKACSNAKFGVKTRLAVEHTCDDNPKEPETVNGNEAEKEVCEMCGKESELKSEHLCEDCFNSLP